MILVLDQQFIILRRKTNTISQNYVYHTRTRFWYTCRNILPRVMFAQEMAR